MSDPVNYNNLKRPKTRSSVASKKKESSSQSIDTTIEELSDRSDKKTKISKLNVFSNNDTPILRSPSKSLSNIKTYGSKTTTQSTTQQTIRSTTRPSRPAAKEISTMPLPAVVVEAPKAVSTPKVTQGSKESVKADYGRELTKLIKIGQSNAVRLKDAGTKLEVIEEMVKDQKEQIEEIMSVLKDHKMINSEIKMKGKGKKDKRADNFYQDAVKKIAHEFFHEHKQLSEQQMKENIKAELDADEFCASILQKSEEKGLTFDEIWKGKIHSALLAAIRSKKGYYIKRVKDNLWATFGVNRIKPFKDSFTKQQMKEWKLSQTTRKVYEDLYKPSDPDDATSDTYIALIIKSVFAVEKERTHTNAIWVQSVLEIIFSEKHLSTKIDSDIIETWTDAITDTEMGSEHDSNCDSPLYSPPPHDNDEDNDKDDNILLDDNITLSVDSYIMDSEY